MDPDNILGDTNRAGGSPTTWETHLARQVSWEADLQWTKHSVSYWHKTGTTGYGGGTLAAAFTASGQTTRQSGRPSRTRVGLRLCEKYSLYPPLKNGGWGSNSELFMMKVVLRLSRPKYERAV